MEAPLVSLIDLQGPQVLIGEYVWHHLPGQEPGTYTKVWARVGDVEPGTGRFWLEDGQGEWYYRPVERDEIRIGVGTRLPDDSLLLKLKEKGLQFEEFVVAVPGAPMEPPQAQRAPPAAPPPQARAQPPEPRRVQVPPLQTPGAGVFSAFTPRFLQEPEMAGTAARFEKAFKDLVQKGSLVSHMEAVLRSIPREARAWYPKAEQLFELYKEPDSKAAHLMAAVFFYSTRINFVLLDLEYLAENYIAEMRTLIEEAGDSAGWNLETIHSLEAKVKRAYEEHRKEAQTQLGKGYVRPMTIRGVTLPGTRNTGGMANRGGGSGGKRFRNEADHDKEGNQDQPGPQNRGPRRARIRAETPTEADAQEALTPDGGADENTTATRADDKADGQAGSERGLADAEPHSPVEGLGREAMADGHDSSERTTQETPPLKLEREQPGDDIPALIDNEGQADEQLGDAGNRGKGRPVLPKPPADGLCPPSAEDGELGGEDEEDMVPDLASDPLVEEGEYVSLEGCTYEFFSGLSVRKAEPPDGEALKEKLRDVLRRAPGPRDGSQLSGEEKADIEDWLRNVNEHTLDPEEFVAGSFNRHLPAWEELLKGSTRESSKRVLRILKAGVKPQFVGTGETEPKKLDQVRGMLRRVVAPGRVESMLEGQVPHEVEFANHKSFYDNLPFAVREVVKMVINATLTVYRPGDRKPKVVNPLGVVNLPKGRLVLNGRYVNAFSKKHGFKYETLREILTFLSQSGFFSTWDFKAGYYHVTINPAFRKYFGIKVGEVYFHYNAMCFGWSGACFIYTLITQEAAKELRLRSITVSSYLDDGFTGDEDFWRCAWAIVFAVQMLTVLGALFSLSKCNFRPRQEGPWLGFVVETPKQRLSVAPAKMEKVKGSLRELLQAGHVSARQLAKVAGKIISISPAVLPAALYSRPFFAVMQGKLSWDNLFPTPESARNMAKLFLEKLDEWNGRRWYPRTVTFEAGSDASETGVGGTIRIPGRPVLTVVASLSPTERGMSSTAREVIAFHQVLLETIRQAGKVLEGAAVLLSGDNQGAVRAINAFRSRAPDVNEALQRVFKLCAEKDFDVVAQWKPREEMQAEDDLSKHRDSSDWGLRSEDKEKVLATFGVQPAIDLFASEAWHITEKFVSLHLTPGCIAADALRADWRDLVQPGEIAWIFPPVRLLKEVIQAVRRFRTDCILIVPLADATNWWLALHQLARIARIEGPVRLHRGTDVCIPSYRVPTGTVNPALYRLQAYMVVWSDST